MGTLTVCMIVKDEAHQVADILMDCQAFADEIVVVDTGSEDDTKRVVLEAASLARLYDYEWHDDFSAARNHAMSKASCDYILTLDADDRIDEESQRKIALLKNKFDGKSIFYFGIRNINPNGEHEAFYQLRCFPNTPDIRYKGRIHNQVDIAGDAEKYCRLQPAGIVINHLGYSDPDVLARKRSRTFRILKKEAQEDGERSPRVHIYLGLHYYRQGKIKKAYKYIKKAIFLCGDRHLNEKEWGLYQGYFTATQAAAALGLMDEAIHWWKQFCDFVSFDPSLQLEAVSLAEELGLYEAMQSRQALGGVH